MGGLEGRGQVTQTRSGRATRRRPGERAQCSALNAPSQIGSTNGTSEQAPDLPTRSSSPKAHHAALASHFHFIPSGSHCRIEAEIAPLGRTVHQVVGEIGLRHDVSAHTSPIFFRDKSIIFVSSHATSINFTPHPMAVRYTRWLVRKA